MAKTETVKRATGRDQADWYALLDRWGAPGRPYKEIAAFLVDEHGLSRWWAQKLIVEYEQDRGLRSPGARPNGTFEIGASKTIAAPAKTVFEAVTNSRRRRTWLSRGSMRLQTSQAPASARFAWEDGTSQVALSIEKKGSSKSLVTVLHNRFTDGRKAQDMKECWRESLTNLKKLLEQ